MHLIYLLGIPKNPKKILYFQSFCNLFGELIQKISLYTVSLPKCPTKGKPLLLILVGVL